MGLLTTGFQTGNSPTGNISSYVLQKKKPSQIFSCCFIIVPRNSTKCSIGQRTFHRNIPFHIILKLFLLVIWSLADFPKTVEGAKTPSGLYQDDGRGNTVLTKRLTHQDVHDLSFDLLNIMGFDDRPHPILVDSKSPASQFLLEVYNSFGGSDADVDLSNGKHGRQTSWAKSHHLTDLGWSEFNLDPKEVDAIAQADTIISFVNRGPKFSSILKTHAKDKQFWFDVAEVSESQLALGAELRLWKKSLVNPVEDVDGEKNQSKEVVRISINLVVQDENERFVLHQLDEVETGSWEQGWIRLNVTPSFKQWVENPDSNYGLIISLKSGESGKELDLKTAGFASMLEDEEHQPFLVSFLKGGNGKPKESSDANKSKFGATRASIKRKQKSRRKERTLEFAETLDRPRSCQMGMLYVNFKDLGWEDWVIAPEGFIAYYCHGECSFPLTASMNATNHAIVSTLVHTYYPLEYPKPTCTPVKLGSISMLYYDDNSNVNVKKYQNMVVKACGCK